MAKFSGTAQLARGRPQTRT